MPFSSMDDLHSKGSRNLEYLLDGWHDASDTRENLGISTLNGTEAVWVHKISLHVDDYERCLGEWKVKVVGTGIWQRHLD